jgi:hypothetical protein
LLTRIQTADRPHSVVGQHGLQRNEFDGGEDMKAGVERESSVTQEDAGRKEYEKPELLIYESLQTLTGGPGQPSDT